MLALARRMRERGPYVVQADIATVHAISESPAATDWKQIAKLYEEIEGLPPGATDRRLVSETIEFLGQRPSFDLVPIL